jgi:hypothetical protein
MKGKGELLGRQAHYDKAGIQPVEYIMGSFPPDGVRGYFAGNIIKYLYRYRDKNGVEDLKKARVYLNWLIEWEGEDAAKLPRISNKRDRVGRREAK